MAATDDFAWLRAISMISCNREYKIIETGFVEVLEELVLSVNGRASNMMEVQPAAATYNPFVQVQLLLIMHLCKCVSC